MFVAVLNSYTPRPAIREKDTSGQSHLKDICSVHTETDKSS